MGVSRQISCSCRYDQFCSKFVKEGLYLAGLFSEIKMIVWSIISKSTPRLKGNEYKVLDRMNVTSAPPEGELYLVPRHE